MANSVRWAATRNDCSTPYHAAEPSLGWSLVRGFCVLGTGVASAADTAVNIFLEITITADKTGLKIMQRKYRRTIYETKMTAEQRLNRVCSILSLGVMRLAEARKAIEPISATPTPFIETQNDQTK